MSRSYILMAACRLDVGLRSADRGEREKVHLPTTFSKVYESLKSTSQQKVYGANPVSTQSPASGGDALGAGFAANLRSGVPVRRTTSAGDTLDARQTVGREARRQVSTTCVCDVTSAAT